MVIVVVSDVVILVIVVVSDVVGVEWWSDGGRMGVIVSPQEGTLTADSLLAPVNYQCTWLHCSGILGN